MVCQLFLFLSSTLLFTLKSTFILCIRLVKMTLRNLLVYLKRKFPYIYRRSGYSSVYLPVRHSMFFYYYLQILVNNSYDTNFYRVNFYGQ